MTTIYVFKLTEDKYYISEFKNEIIDSIHSMIEKLLSKKDINYNQLLTQNLGATLSSIEWIKKYPIEKIFEIRENTNLEKISIYYIKKYGIDKIRSDLYKDIELSESNINYINNLLDESLESVSNRINLINKEITELKSIFDIIGKNNIVIEKYKNYGLVQLNKIVQNQHLSFSQQIQHQLQLKQSQDYERLNLYHQEINKLVYTTCNLLLPNFIDSFIKDKSKDFSPIMIDIIKSIFEEYFSDHKLVEKIANALLLQKKNEKLISKYGTLDEINKKLSNMLYRKIDLIHMLNEDIDEKNDIDEKE